MARVKFIIQTKDQNARIHCRFSISRNNVLKRKTRYTVDSKKWNYKEGLPSGRDGMSKALKGELENLKQFIYNQYNNDISRGIDINGEWLEIKLNNSIINNLTSGFEELDEKTRYPFLRFIEDLRKDYPPLKNPKTNLPYARTTRSQYLDMYNKLESYIVERNKNILISEVGPDIGSDFANFLDQKGLSSTTIGRKLKMMKTLLKEARYRGYSVHSEIEKIKGGKGESHNTYLTFSDLDEIEKAALSDTLDIARDWLIIGCFTGQRISDMYNFNKDSIVAHDGFDFIQVTQVKTNNTVLIPIHNKVGRILEKRNGMFPPLFGNKKDSHTAILNKKIKEVCRLAGINDEVNGMLFDSEQGRNTVKKHPKWKLVSSHICRRSFASNFYGDKNYPTPLLMSVTGHKSEAQFLDYIKKPRIDLSMQLAEIWNRQSID